MSIQGMADQRVLEQVAAQPPAPGASPTEPEAPAPVGVSTNIVNQLVTWIPAESITLYVAYVALFDPVTAQPGQALCRSDFTPRWVGFWTFIILTSLLALGGYVGKRRQLDPRPPFRPPVFAMVIAPVAFAAWAAALPDTPFADVCGYKASIGGFAVIVSAVGISFVAWMLGKSADYIKAPST